MRLARLAAVGFVIALSAAAGIAAAGRTDGRWVWQVGDSTASVGRPQGSGNLVLSSLGDIDLQAGHVRLMANDGDFRFVHANSGPAVLNAYYIGTPTRTPLQIGYAAGDVTSLIVAGSSGQHSDLQRWTIGGKTVAAIDGKGRLRLGAVTLAPEVVNGRVRLYALAGGRKQLVAAGRPTR